MKLSFVIVALLAISAYAQEAEVAAPKTTAGSATQEALSALQGGLKEHNEFYSKAVTICKEELPAAQKIVDQAEDRLRPARDGAPRGQPLRVQRRPHQVLLAPPAC